MSKTDKDAEPVDAEFKDVSDSDAPSRKGGGLLGGLVLFVLATLAGGALGAWGAQFLAPSGSAYDDTGLLASIEAVETRLSELEAAEPDVTLAMISALEDRIEALETAEPAEAGLDSEALTALETRIAALENAEPAETGTDPALSQRLTRLEQQAERAEALANQALDLPAGADAAALDQLQDRVAALESVEPPAPVEAPDLSGLEARLAALETADPAISEDRIEALETRLAAAEQAATAAGSATDETASARSLAARTLALIALAEIAETEDSFEAERAALARLWPGREELAALRPLARAGVPTRALLAETFPSDAIRNAAGRQTVFFGLIEVQRTGEAAEGDSPQALTRLAEARLARGDLEGAVAAVTRLEGDAAEAAQAWLLGAEARLTVEDSLDALRAALARQAGLEE